MLTLVPQGHDEAQELLHFLEFTRNTLRAAFVALLLPLLGVALVLSGLNWGGLMLAPAVSLALSRYGPCWWPGKR